MATLTPVTDSAPRSSSGEAMRTSTVRPVRSLRG